HLQLVRVVCAAIPPPTAESHTLSLHDALPISFADVTQHQFLMLFGDQRAEVGVRVHRVTGLDVLACALQQALDKARVELLVHKQDRKSTRLNSSHVKISYAVFCLKKKKNAVLI